MATIVPAIPSILIPVIFHNKSDKRTTAVATQSERLSVDVASIAAESSLFPSERLNKNIQVFISIEPTSIITDKMLKYISSGLNIRATELLKSSTPITIIAAATIRPDMYSILPCPNGCSVSAGFPETLNPINVTIDEPASDRLLNASAATDTAPVIIPARNLSKNKIILHVIPTIPESMPYFCLTTGLSVSLLFFINIFNNSSVIALPQSIFS